MIVYPEAKAVVRSAGASPPLSWGFGVPIDMEPPMVHWPVVVLHDPDTVMLTGGGAQATSGRNTSVATIPAPRKSREFMVISSLSSDFVNKREFPATSGLRLELSNVKVIEDHDL